MPPLSSRSYAKLAPIGSSNYNQLQKTAKCILMTQQQKLIEKFKAAKKTFKWNDLVAVLTALGFEQIEAAGSRVLFSRNGNDILLHKPHPGNEVKAYVLKQVKETLKQSGDL